MDANYADLLRKKCHKHFNNEALVLMDPQSSIDFDGHYFKNLYENKGIFQPDAALLTDAN